VDSNGRIVDMRNYTLEEVTEALKDESVGDSQTRYILNRLEANQLANLLRGKLSDPKTDYYTVANRFIVGHLDTEAVVRLAHGNNMNVVYNILCDFNLKRKA
jgi:hypothetical protein